MRSVSRVFVTTALLLSLGGCEEQPGETVTGVVQSPEPLTLPLSGKKACVARLTLSRTADTSSGGHSVDTLEHRWAPRATMTVDGKVLAISGTKGKPSYTETGDNWHWNKSYTDKRPPRELWGWGHDSTFEALSSKSGHLGTKHVSVTEEFAPCGAEISVRSLRKGDTLVLVDTNEVDTSNTLKAAGVMIAGFLCCGVFPMVLLIGFVVRRAVNKKKARGLD